VCGAGRNVLFEVVEKLNARFYDIALNNFNEHV
jgi:hypothetical protein